MSPAAKYVLAAAGGLLLLVAAGSVFLSSSPSASTVPVSSSPGAPSHVLLIPEAAAPKLQATEQPEVRRQLPANSKTLTEVASAKGPKTDVKGGPVAWQDLLPVVDPAAEKGLDRELKFYVSNVEKIARRVGAVRPQPAPKYLRPAEQPAIPLEYIMVIGVEGVGHHGVYEWLETLAFLSGRVPLRNALYYAEPTLARGRNVSRLNKPFAAAGQALGRPIVPVVWFSFPCRTWGRNLTACEADYDACFRKISAATGIYQVAHNYESLSRSPASVKFLLLDRAFPAATWSHKSWDGGYIPHARLMAIYKRFLSAEAASIPQPRKNWAHLRYESLCQTGPAQLSVARKLAEFLNWPVSNSILQQSLQNAFHPSSKNALAEMSDLDLDAIGELYATHEPHWTAYADRASALDSIDWVANDVQALKTAIAERKTRKPGQ